MREIVFDTETTGLEPLRGDRIVEIGCVELHNHVTTGRTFQVYLNPERSMPSEAAMVHGLTDEFLADKPLFAEKVDDFLAFIENSPLVAHNATFDMNFVNAELTRCGFKRLEAERAIDTVAIARRMFPGSPASLDALCKRFGIDASGRQLHGALLDAQLLAEVYLELRGGRQPGLDMLSAQKSSENGEVVRAPAMPRKPRVFSVPAEERAAHDVFLDTLKNPLWKRS
ncbi:MAG: DNA polymerase III subunit epsilon [Alphaproteobacteria bacterium]|nr:DNA polymerase III subunit epsilon [Alphaproteobacteria bacterium]